MMLFTLNEIKGFQNTTNKPDDEHRGQDADSRIQGENALHCAKEEI